MTVSGSIPTRPGAVPLLGHLPALLRDPHALLMSLPEHGDLVRVRLGPARVVVVCEPGLTRQVLRDDRTFDKGGLLSDRSREAAGDGLITCPHSRHRRQRRLVQPAFRPDRMPGYAHVMAQQVTTVIGGWRDGQLLDVVAEMTTITTSIVAATLFPGTSLSNTLSGSAPHQMFADVATIPTGIYRRMLTPPPLDRFPTPGNRRYHRAITRLRATLDDIITNCRASGTDGQDLLSALVTARDPDGDSLNDTEIADQVITFFLAGSETMASALSWAWHLLAGHPDIQRRLHTEVDTVLADGRPATHDDLPRLELTHRVVTETLRLWPPGWILTRVTAVATELGGHAIPAGTPIVFSPYLIHHRPDLYPDPDRFDPDRWLPERAAAIPREAYIPFSAGARKCIGDQFSLTEAALTLATITRHWRLHPIPGCRVRPALSIAQWPSGLRMRATSRTTPQPNPHGPRHDRHNPLPEV